MGLSLKTRGILSVIGGFLVLHIMGTFYLWGTICVYVASYLHYNGSPELTIG